MRYATGGLVHDLVMCRLSAQTGETANQPAMESNCCSYGSLTSDARFRD